MSKEINLESIILEVYGCKDVHELQRDFDVSVQMIKEIAIEAIRQALELAAEKIRSDAMETFGSDINDCWDDQSIINTINQIK